MRYPATSLAGNKMAERRVSTDFGLIFIPEQWSAVNKFRQLMGPPFDPTPDLGRGVSATENHLEKFVVLAGLADRFKDRLAEDNAELEETGRSSAIRSKEFSALVEALFCELYAVLDGVRRAIYGAYRNVRGVQNKSTERVFKRAAETEYGPEFPDDIRAALACAFASWFPRLRSIRTEVTHGEIGFCHLDEKSHKIVYIHHRLGSRTKALVIDDVAAELSEQYTSVWKLVEAVFQSLYSKLHPIERTEVDPFV
jgi:hypothetical protein